MESEAGQNVKRELAPTGSDSVGAELCGGVPFRSAIANDPTWICDRGSVSAFALYALLSLFFFGRALIPDCAGSYVGRGPDPSFFVWAITWWPYAISHLLNPMMSRIIFVPSGVNIAWMTAIPLGSLLVWPITAAFGPVVAYNCLALLAPASAAWTTFVLCRALTRSMWAAVFAGYIFGFSGYFLAHIAGGHLVLVLVFPVPIALYLVVQWFDGMIESRRMACLTGLMLAAQFYLSVEIFATATMFGALALFLALTSTSGELYRRIVRMSRVLACAYGLALLIIAPYLYYLFAYGAPRGQLWDTVQFSADLLNFLIPTSVNALGVPESLRKIATTFPGNEFERVAYVGPVLIGLALVYARLHWKEPLGKVLIDSLVVICVLSFGPMLHLGGRELVGMPGKGLAIVPAIEKALPVRFMMYAYLILAIIAALWIATSSARIGTKRVVVILAVLFSLPNFDACYWNSRLDTPDFFTKGLYKEYLIPGENVIVAPYWILGNSMLWQAQTGMYFRMAGGYSGPLPDDYKTWPVVKALTEWTPLPDPQAQLMSFLANHQVGAIVVSDRDPDRSLWQRWLPAAVATPLEIGGVTLYRINPSAQSRYCGLTEVDAERQADFALFNGLLAAASKYDAEGRRPELLTPFAAERLGLIPADWLPGPVWVPEWVVGTKFDMTLDADQPMYRGVWLGYAGGTFLGIGIKGTYRGLKPIIEHYRSDAYRIYFPFPKGLGSETREGDRGLMVVFFKPDGLKRAMADSATRNPDER